MTRKTVDAWDTLTATPSGSCKRNTPRLSVSLLQQMFAFLIGLTLYLSAIAGDLATKDRLLTALRQAHRALREEKDELAYQLAAVNSQYAELNSQHAELHENYATLLARSPPEVEQVELKPGSGVFLAKSALSAAHVEGKRSNVLARCLFRRLFTDEEMASHTLFGKGSNANRKAGLPPALPGLSPRRTEAALCKFAQLHLVLDVTLIYTYGILVPFQTTSPTMPGTRTTRSNRKSVQAPSIRCRARRISRISSKPCTRA